MGHHLVYLVFHSSYQVGNNPSCKGIFQPDPILCHPHLPPGQVRPKTQNEVAGRESQVQGVNRVNRVKLTMGLWLTRNSWGFFRGFHHDHLEILA